LKCWVRACIENHNGEYRKDGQPEEGSALTWFFTDEPPKRAERTSHIIKSPSDIPAKTQTAKRDIQRRTLKRRLIS